MKTEGLTVREACEVIRQHFRDQDGLGDLRALIEHLDKAKEYALDKETLPRVDIWPFQLTAVKELMEMIVEPVGNKELEVERFRGFNWKFECAGCGKVHQGLPNYCDDCGESMGLSKGYSKPLGSDEPVPSDTPKPLTFDEAVKCERVKVKNPYSDHWLDFVYVKNPDFCNRKGWPMWMLNDFDLAERRGWTMTDVSQRCEAVVEVEE